MNGVSVGFIPVGCTSPPTAEDAAMRAEQMILDSYTPPLTEKEQRWLWVAIKQPTDHRPLPNYSILTGPPPRLSGYSVDNLPPRRALKAMVAEEEEADRQAKQDERILRKLSKAIRRACSQLGVSKRDIELDIDTKLNEVTVAFRGGLAALASVDADDDEISIRLFPAGDVNSFFCGYISLSSLYVPGSLLRYQLAGVMLGLIATHPEVTPFIERFEHPLPLTLALCESVLCAPADQMPAAARQWVLLHLEEAV